MPTHITVIPAYGRDYKTQKEVLAAWNADQDFLIQSFGHPYDGKVMNRPQAKPGEVINIRYKGKTQVAVIRV